MFISTAFFAFGLIIGSFLNAVLWRMKEGMGLGGRSLCPSCRAMIHWYDNIPVLSFLFLGGKCRACRNAISWRYPIVEFSTGILFLFLGNAFFVWWDALSWIEIVFYMGASSLLILIFLHDLDTMEIPNILLWIGVGWAVSMLLLLDAYGFNPVTSAFSTRLHPGILAGIVGFLPLFLMATLSKERWMGMGDGFLAFFLGLLVGWPGILVALFLSFGIGAIVGVVLIALKKKGMQSQVPLGPFLIVGTFLSIFLPKWFPGMLESLFWFLG